MWILLKNEFNYSLVKIEKYKKDFYMYKMVTVRTLKSFARLSFPLYAQVCLCFRYSRFAENYHILFFHSECLQCFNKDYLILN